MVQEKDPSNRNARRHHCVICSLVRRHGEVQETLGRDVSAKIGDVLAPASSQGRVPPKIRTPVRLPRSSASTLPGPVPVIDPSKCARKKCIRLQREMLCLRKYLNWRLYSSNCMRHCLWHRLTPLPPTVAWVARGRQGPLGLGQQPRRLPPPPHPAGSFSGPPGPGPSLSTRATANSFREIDARDPFRGAVDLAVLPLPPKSPPVGV